MEQSIIIGLAIILFVLIGLNHITIITSTNTTSNASTASCSQTSFGCCPNGVDSKINYYGTNCPNYKPGPGYSQIPSPVQPIGGCAGTRYGCCPNNNTLKINVQGSNCIVK